MAAGDLSNVRAAKRMRVADDTVLSSPQSDLIAPLPGRSTTSLASRVAEVNAMVGEVLLHTYLAMIILWFYVSDLQKRT